MLRRTEAHMVSAGRKYLGPSMIALASESLQIKITCLMNCIYCHIRKNQWPEALKLCERIMDDSVARDRMSPIEMLRLMYFKCFAMINSILNTAVDGPERVQKVADVQDAVQDMLRLLVNSHARHENNFKGASNDLREILELNKLLGNSTSSMGARANLVPGDTAAPGTMQSRSSVQNTAIAGVDAEVPTYNANSESGVRIIAQNHDIQQKYLQAQQVTLLGKQLGASENKRSEQVTKHRVAMAVIQAEKDNYSKQLSTMSAQLERSERQCAELLHQLEAINAHNNENQRLLSILSSKLVDESCDREELLQLIQQHQGQFYAQASASTSYDEYITAGSLSMLEEARSLIMLRIPMDLSEKGASSDLPQIAGAGEDFQTQSSIPAEGSSLASESILIQPHEMGSNTQNVIADVDESYGMQSYAQYDGGASRVRFQEPPHSVVETAIETRSSNEIVNYRSVEEPNEAHSMAVESILLLHGLPQSSHDDKLEHPPRQQNLEVVH